MDAEAVCCWHQLRACAMQLAMMRLQRRQSALTALETNWRPAATLRLYQRPYGHSASE
jgi:hypothetical protein